MNLVQINERLKDLPMQVVQQYANGMNPEVPPYLALGELQRREIAQKQMATAQGAQQGPQPSVKEQVEQKAGLMALQQMQQQQMVQQQAQPRGPMPAPAGVPQPEPQPEAMMARGGLASIPVRSDMFEYSGGGIIAFSGEDRRVGSVVPESEIARILKKPPSSRTTEENAALERSGQKLQRAKIPEDSAIRQADRALREVGPGIREYFTEGASRLSDEELANRPAVGGAQNERILRAIGIGPSAPPSVPAPPAPIEQASLRKMEAQMAPAGLPAAAQQMTAAATPPAAPRPPMPSAPRPTAAPSAAQQAGLPAAAQEKSPYFAQVDADLARPITAPTPEGIIAQQRALSPEAMQEEFMKKRMQEQRDRAAGERAAFEKTRPSGLDDLIRVFGQAGQYKGLSGTGPAYTANQQQKRAEELAMEKRQNELLSAIDAREYEGAKELFGARSKSMDAANTAYQNQLMTRTKALADIAGVDQRRMDEAANRLTQVQIEKLRITARAAEANRPGEAERIEATYMAMVANKKQAEADEYLARISKIKGGVGGDRNPTPTDRLRAAQSIVNDMDATPEEKAEARKEITRIMSGGAGGGGGPKIGEVQQGYRFKGGNPADQSNWEKVK
jgi:hypothetical protein